MIRLLSLHWAFKLVHSRWLAIALRAITNSRNGLANENQICKTKVKDFFCNFVSFCHTVSSSSVWYWEPTIFLQLTSYKANETRICKTKVKKFFFRLFVTIFPQLISYKAGLVQYWLPFEAPLPDQINAFTLTLWSKILEEVLIWKDSLVPGPLLASSSRLAHCGRFSEQ